MLQPGHSGVEERGKVPLRHRPRTSEISQQRRRGRPWQAQAPDQADPWLQVDEDRLRHEGFEAMCAIKKRQARAFRLQPGIRGEVRLVERAFGMGPDMMSDLMSLHGAELERIAIQQGY